MSAKSIRDLINVNGEVIGDVAGKMFKGEDVDLGAAVMEMGEKSGGIFNQQLEGLGLNFAEQLKKLQESDSKTAEIVLAGFNGLANVIMEKTGVDIRAALPNLPTTVEQGQVGGAAAQGQQTQTINNNSTVDVNIKLEVPPGMSTQEVLDALGAEAVKQQIVKIVEDKLPDLKTKPK